MYKVNGELSSSDITYCGRVPSREGDINGTQRGGGGGIFKRIFFFFFFFYTLILYIQIVLSVNQKIIQLQVK